MPVNNSGTDLLMTAAVSEACNRGSPKLLVLDSSFTLEAIQERSLEHTVTCRDLDGFFEHVWSVHPFATMLTTPGWAKPWGPPRFFELAPSHRFVEGSVGRYKFLRRAFALNFLVAQIGLFFTLWGLCRREGIDVVRAGDPHYLGLLGWALARATGAKLVVRVGANYDKIHQDTGRPIQPRLLRSRRIEKRIERFVFRHADLVAGANQNNLDFAIANGARPDRSTLFRYGNLVDKRHFVDPKARPKGNPLGDFNRSDTQFMLYVGRLVAEKYASDLIHVVAELRRGGRDILLVCAGDGPLRPEMEALCAKLHVSDLVILAGNKSQGWLSEALVSASLVLSPHTGRALTEAALAGATIVAYDVDWQGELIRTEETGILVPAGDWRAMAAAAARCLDDPEFAWQMGSAARRAALTICDPKELDEHERAQYRALLDRRDRARA